jgi:hypothetical protein
LEIGGRRGGEMMIVRQGHIFLRDGDKVVGTIILEDQLSVSKVDGKVFVETDGRYLGLKEEPTLAVSDKNGVVLLQRADGAIAFYPEALELDITILDGVLSIRQKLCSMEERNEKGDD